MNQRIKLLDVPVGDYFKDPRRGNIFQRSADYRGRGRAIWIHHCKPEYQHVHGKTCSYAKTYHVIHLGNKKPTL